MIFLSAMMSVMVAVIASVHRWIIGVWHPRPSLHHNAVSDNRDHSTAQSQHVPDDSSTRAFETILPHRDTLEEINDRIRALEPLERSLAERYKLGEYFDSVDVFQMAKAGALSRKDGQSRRDLHDMDGLYELRSRRADILQGLRPSS
ncbi:hypothetical protein F5146DRAFT_1064897 [Armillaria mellea]|nr:hypothetical protein F5146DRAFT_1064897 [Armillaria mellea]